MSFEGPFQPKIYNSMIQPQNIPKEILCFIWALMENKVAPSAPPNMRVFRWAELTVLWLWVYNLYETKVRAPLFHSYLFHEDSVGHCIAAPNLYCYEQKQSNGSFLLAHQ